MQDLFHELTEQLHEHGLAVDPPYLHGLLTGFATTPNLDSSLVWPEIQQEGELPERLQEEVTNVIGFLSEDLALHDFEALYNADRDDEPERWIKGYFRAVELHEDQWEEWNETYLDAGTAMLMLRALIDDQVRQALNIEQSGHEALREEPEIVTVLVQAIYHHFFGSPYEEDEISADLLPSIPSFGEGELQAMDEAALYQLLTTLDDLLPLEVVHECAGRGDAMVLLLRQHLETEENWGPDATSGEWWALLHAIFILGLIPGKTAAEALLEGFRRTTFDWENELADWVSGYWPALCRNKSEHTTEPMRAITLDRSLDWYPRNHALECVLAYAAEQGPDQLEAAVDWLAALCADESESAEFRTMACGNRLLDFPRERHRPLMEQVAALGGEDNWFFRSFDQKDIDYAFSESEDHPEWERFDNPWQFYDPDAIEQRQRRWLREEMEWEEEREPLQSYDWTPVETITRDQPKVGRNDPCPCGSGKKYKKCCLH